MTLKRDRVIANRLAAHYKRMSELEAHGMPRDEASRQALAEMTQCGQDQRYEDSLHTCGKRKGHSGNHENGNIGLEWEGV